MYRKEKASKEEVEAGNKLEALLDDFKELSIDPDTASFLLITAGMMLMLNSNKDDPHYVSYLLSTAIMNASAHASNQLIIDEENGETKH
jgi:hypothetical protein